jgi:hypothetical protein
MGGLEEIGVIYGSLGNPEFMATQKKCDRLHIAVWRISG